MTKPKPNQKKPLVSTDRGMTLLPAKVEFTFSMPGLEEALQMLMKLASEHASRELRNDGPFEERRIAMEEARIEIDRDRQKLAWEELHLRQAEFESRRREEEERHAERRTENARRQREEEERQAERKAEQARRGREEALLRGEIYDAWLMERGATPIAVIKVVRQYTELGLKEAKDLVDACPALVKSLMMKAPALELLAALTAAGARAEMRTVKSPAVVSALY
jgi:ribosomal protein L7/L12